MSHDARADLRLPALAVVVWLASLAARQVDLLWISGVVAVGVACSLLFRCGATAVAWVIMAGAAAMVAGLHMASVRGSPVTALAADEAVVNATVRVTSDPHVSKGRFGDVVTARATITSVTGRGRAARVRAPVLLIGKSSLTALRLGSTVELSGRLAPPEAGDLAGVLLVRGSPVTVAGPGLAHRGADSVRAAIRAAVAGHGEGPRALVPALVDGDDGALPADIEADFRTVGLTHLLAVSGTNLK